MSSDASSKSSPNRRTWWPLAYLGVMLAIAFAAATWRARASSLSCEMDGQAVLSNLQVDLKMADGPWHTFCSIECARRWLAEKGDDYPDEAIVRDALTGEPLDAYVAIFVQSKIETNSANGNNIHAFRYQTEAANHIRRFGGHEIDSPF